MNLNILVSNVLNSTVHPYEKGKVVFYDGEVNTKGKITSKYSLPIDVLIQSHNSSQKQLEHIGMANRAENKRVFYLNLDLNTISRIKNKGGDFIYYRNEWYKITQVRDDFFEVGWVSVIGTSQLKAPEGVII